MLKLKVFSDFVCPFCYVGAGLLEKLKGELAFEVEWLPYELNNMTPAEGVDMAAYFGTNAAGVEKRTRPVQQMAEQLGLPYQQPKKIYNSHRALLLAEYGRDRGVYERLHELLFEAYFVKNQNLHDDAVLREAAQAAGLDPEEALASLPNYEERLQKAQIQARSMGVTAVPNFIINDRYRIAGVQPYEYFKQALEKIAAEGAQ